MMKDRLIDHLGGECWPTYRLHLSPHLPPCGVATTRNTVLQQIPTDSSINSVHEYVYNSWTRYIYIP